MGFSDWDVSTETSQFFHAWDPMEKQTHVNLVAMGFTCIFGPWNLWDTQGKDIPHGKAIPHGDHI